MKFEVNNLRGVSRVPINLKPITVLLGKNGSGKTSVLKALSLGSEIARAQFSTKQGFRLDPAWIRKFDLYSVSELMKTGKEEASMTWRWEIEELEYHFHLERSKKGIESLVRFDVVYPKIDRALYSVSVTDKIYFECAIEYVNLLHYFEEDVIHDVSFNRGVVSTELDPKDPRFSDAQEAERLMFAIAKGECEWYKASDEVRDMEFAPETGLMAIWSLNEKFRAACKVDSPSGMFAIMYRMRPGSSTVIPRVKYFKMSNRTYSSRSVEPNDELWAPMMERFAGRRARPWAAAGRRFIEEACRIFLLPHQITLEKTKANNILIRVGSHRYLHQFGTGHRQILRLILELSIVIDFYSSAKNKGKKEVARQIYLVEEPEVSLHPDAQSRILDLLMLAKSSLKAVGVEGYFIVETHSEYLVRRTQVAVKKNQLQAEDVEFIFLSLDEDEQIQALEVEVTPAGMLAASLPKGFLDETIRLIDDLHFS